MSRAAIVGASGYAGMELTRLLAQHPDLDLVAVGSGRWDGRSVRDVLGVSGPTGALTYQAKLDDVAPVDVVFFGTPADVSRRCAAAWAGRARVMVDLSNAFRDDAEWVYGLSELRRERVRGHARVANPGCYPTAAQLGLVPLLEAGLVGAGPIVIDAKSGATGAGRMVADHLLFNELAGNHFPYRVGNHQHVPEIERGLGGREIVFTPHLLPTRRGLFTSSYIPVREGVTPEDLERCLRERYEGEPYVQVVPCDTSIGLATVVGTPRCRLAVGPTVKAGLARVFGTLDNLMKGAASQALQNANLALGFAETAGISS